VKIRFKQMAKGRRHIYLDCYRDGKRTYEFLKLYLLHGKDATTRAMNDNAMAAARTIQLERTVEIQNNGTPLKVLSRGKMLLDDVMRLYEEELRRRGSRGADSVSSPRKILRSYAGNSVTLRNVNKDFCKGFIEYLRTYKSKAGTEIANSTKISYLGVFSAALNYAVRQDWMTENPLNKIPAVDKFKSSESQRAYLTIDELKKMMDTPSYRDDVCRAYLFASYCGLRLSDIRALKWGDIKKDGKQWRAEVVQRKTDQPLYLPLSDYAVSYMPKRGDKKDTDLVFGKLPAKMTCERVLRMWAQVAGIEKYITFHTSRHTVVLRPLRDKLPVRMQPNQRRIR